MLPAGGHPGARGGGQPPPPAGAREGGEEGRAAPTAEYLELLGWSLFVTNCPEEELTWKAVVVLYRARWQIELLFKLWKSHNRLAEHREGASALEVLAVFYAKLLGVLLQHWILVATAWQIAGRSLTKAARALAEVVKQILLALGDGAAAGGGAAAAAGGDPEDRRHHQPQERPQSRPTHRRSRTPRLALSVSCAYGRYCRRPDREGGR